MAHLAEIGLAPKVQRGGDVFDLIVVYRSQGLRLPLRPDDLVEIWSRTSDEPIFTITGALLIALLSHHIDGLAVQAVLRGAIEAPKDWLKRMMPQEPHPVPERQRDAFRARRRSRRAP